MIQELEEGETCYYKDDSSVDPDVALSYIGERVQSLLGHFQKDFEGGFSVENLGPKFGGYGSFLPSQQRSPSILTQPKPPQRVHNSHLSRSPNVCPEGPAPNLLSTQRVDSCASLKTSFHDAPIKQKPIVVSDKVAEIIPPSSKPVNPPDQRTLKVRIKVGPERALYNAEICNLGLTSSSSSEGNSDEESDGLLNEYCETPNESPSTILKIMTSLPLSGDLVLSPLSEDLINLAREIEKPVESNVHKNPAMSVRLLNNNVIVGKKTNYVDKSGKTKKPDDEVIVKRSDCKQKTPGGENVGTSLQPFHKLEDVVQVTEKDAKVKKRKESKIRVKEKKVPGDLVKDTIPGHASEQSHGKDFQSETRCSSVENTGEHRARISLKGALVDQEQGSKNRSKVNHASFRAHSDNSDGEEVRKAMDNSSLKSGLNATSTEHNVSGIPLAVNRLSLEGEKRSQGTLNSGKLASKDEHSEKKGIRKLHLSKKKHVENPKRLLDTASGEKPRNLNLDPVVKPKSASTDKLKGRPSSKKFSERVSYEALLAEPPPAASLHSKEGIIDNGLKQAVVAPQVIEDNWVCCDRCGKWRLLPYGTKSENLPEKWECSLLDWLPGMNYCHFSEDETTKALQALYVVPLPESQQNFQTHADGTNAGVIASSSHQFNPIRENHSSDSMKKHTLKEKRNTVSMRDSVPSNGKLQLKRLPERNESSSKVVKQFNPGLNATNNPDMQHSNRAPVASEKINKRKGEHVIEDEVDMRKKIKREPAQHVNVMLKKMKTNDVDDFQTLDGKKKSVQKNTVSGDDSQISVKKQHTYQMQDLPDNRPSGIKKIKLKKYECSSRQVKDGKDGDFHRDKNSQASQIEEERKSADARFQSSVSNENPVTRGIEKEQQQIRKPKAKLKLTSQDIDKIKQDLGYEVPSTAATSSSSKVSGSHKNRVSYVKVKRSPEESVSSSPVRIMQEEKLDSRFNNNVHATGNVREIRDMNGSYELAVARKGISGVTSDNGLEIYDSSLNLKEETDFDARLPLTDNSSSLKSLKKGTSVGGKKGDAKSDAAQQKSAEMEPWSGKFHIDLSKGDKQGGLCRKKQASGLSRSTKRSKDSRPVDASVADNNPKAVKESAIACPLNVTDTINNESDEQSVALEASIGSKNVSTALKEAGVALREAEELRSHADLIKNSGFSSESNYEYFKAALKFLHGAALLETCNGEGSQHVEMNSMQMYGAAGQLCKTCASEYEKSHEMAAASLVYKCMELAYLRVVYCKSSNISRVWHDLQSSLQMVPLGESPSSSASDVDNLNNLVMAEKAPLSKGICGVSHAGTHVIGSRNRLNIFRLLDYTKDATAAMEAAKKSQETFAAARVELEQSRNKEAIVCVKRVIDTSFQDVEELVSLVSYAFNIVSHQGLSGSRE